MITAILALLLSATSIAALAAESAQPIRLTVLCDNVAAIEGMHSGGGFACLVEVNGKTVLFDTGMKPDTLWFNTRKLGFDLELVDTIVLSHKHNDHTGGFASVLKNLGNRHVTIYAPESFPSDFISYSHKDVQLVHIKEFTAIRPGVYLTGDTGGKEKEIGLILDTAEGALLLTGCAHPGIVNIVQKSGQHLGKSVASVLGGFHLRDYDESAISGVVSQLKALGVKKCGPGHCSGDKAIQIFKEEFGVGYLPMGAGRLMVFPCSSK